MPPDIQRDDLNDLTKAKALLENPGLAAKITHLLGTPIEKGFVKTPIKIDPTKIKFLVAPPTSLESLCFPPRDSGLDCLVVSNNGMRTLTVDKSGKSIWKLAK